MKINDSLITFLNNSRTLSHCSILLSDTSKFIFTALYFENDIFIDKKISNDLKNLFMNNYECYTTISSNNPCIKLVEDDNIKYTSQIILPIIHDTFDGILIFFSTDKNYLESNLKFAQTTKYFIEKLSY